MYFRIERFVPEKQNQACIIKMDLGKALAYAWGGGSMTYRAGILGRACFSLCRVAFCMCRPPGLACGARGLI